jgi:RNA polymerase sigma-70 factor, ECF subfamily
MNREALTMPFLVPSSSDRRLSWKELSDRELLTALQRDQDGALDELIARKSQGLMSVVSRMLGEQEESRDIVQVTFVKVWENRHRYRDRWSPNTWIYRIATNLTIDQLRARRRREHAMSMAGPSLRAVDGERRSLAELQEREINEIFRRIAGGLSDRQRLVFLLRAIEGFDTREVAAIVGCRVSTVRNHLFAARRKLRRELEACFPEYLPGARVGSEDESR